VLRALLPALQENPDLLLENTFLQQDGASTHFACSVNLLLNEAILNIGLVISIGWPVHPDKYL
jgi:hypothetical protein